MNNRFALYIESDDPRIAVFAATFGLHLFRNIMTYKEGEDDTELLSTFARIIEQFPEIRTEIARLTDCLSESIENIEQALIQLEKLSFYSMPEPR